jgi:2-polyprenyl-3-methyl-5-hydroxy-6-metoxy-1,4-benzoquinol methylase
MQQQPPTTEEQRQFWNWHWGHWRDRKTVNEWKEARHETVLHFLSTLPVAHPTILDLGCGPGRFTVRLARFGEVTGIDLSEQAIAMAKTQYPQVTFLAGNLYDYPLPRNRFDVVVSQEVVDHVEDRPAFVRRASDLLKSRGYLVLSFANKFVMDRLGDGEFPEQPKHHIGVYSTLNEMRRLLAPHFDVVRTQPIIPGVGKRGILRLVNSYRLNRLIGLLLPQRYIDAMKLRAGFGYQFVILAQRKS